MLRRILGTVLILFLCSTALAQAPYKADADDNSGADAVPRKDHTGTALVLPPLEHGTYILRIPETGPATVEPAEGVVLVGPGPTPPPVPPVPVTLTERAKAIKAAADKVTGDPDREGTAQSLAFLYRETAKAARNSTSADTSVVTNAVSQMSDLALSKLGANVKLAWQPVRDVLGAQFVAATQEGKSMKDFAALLDEAASGLEASAPKKQIKPEFWAFLTELLKILLPLLIPLIKP